MIYSFKVNDRDVLPNYKQDISIEYGKEQNEEFYRARLSSPLKFMGKDFDFLSAQPFETEFEVSLFKPLPRGVPEFIEYFPEEFLIAPARIDSSGRIVHSGDSALAYFTTDSPGIYSMDFDPIPGGAYRVGYVDTKISIYGLDVRGLKTVNGNENSIFIPKAATVILEVPFTYYTNPTQYGKTPMKSSREHYWTGVFYKTDGKWDFDNKIVEVKAEPKDIYTELLTGMDREYNLIELAPPIYPVLVDKRPLIQIYQAGSSTVGCFLGGNAWEQDVASPVWNVDAGHEESLQKKYHFSEEGGFFTADLQVSPSGNPLPGTVGNYSGSSLEDLNGVGGHYITVIREEVTSNIYTWRAKLYDADGKLIMQGNEPGVLTGVPLGFSMLGVEESSARAYLAVDKTTIFKRTLVAQKVEGHDIKRLPSDDIIPGNRNYLYAKPGGGGSTTLSYRVSEEPTKYGRREFEGSQYEGVPEYYLPPTDGDFLYYPVSRLNWGYHSIWFRFREDDAALEKSLRSTYTMSDAFRLLDAIKVLAEKIVSTKVEVRASSLEMGVQQMLTPKSNITAGSYSLAAQRAPVKLKEILDMLKNVFRNYWYLKEEDGVLVLDIKPMSWFNERPTGTDVTEMINKRNGLSWSFATDKIEYDKLDMPSRYEFSWADRTSILFDGEPIEIQSLFVVRDKVESVSADKFSTDIDFMLLAPEKVNPDGFALLQAVEAIEDGALRLRVEYLIQPGGAYKELQNGYLSWFQLHEDTWCVSMPSDRAIVNGRPQFFQNDAIVKNKKQTISFPVEADPAPELLIKTSVGLGKIEKLSVYLHSRMAKAELRQNTYD